jgi:hypothetical protein
LEIKNGKLVVDCLSGLQLAASLEKAVSALFIARIG